MSSSTEIIKYIDHLPDVQFDKLCTILNQYDKIEELAFVWMALHIDEIQTIIEAEDPAKELLITWGKYDHTVLELFILLSKMQYYEPMVLLKPFVDSKYHFLLYSGNRNVHNLTNIGYKNCKKYESKIDAQNLYQNKNHCGNIVNVPVNPINIEDSTKKMKPVILQDLYDNIDLLASKPTIFSTTLPIVSYTELVLVTDDWKEENLLGEGSFSNVYKGVWKNTEVAVKRIQPRHSNSKDYYYQLKISFREIKILDSLRHENILPLFAYSIGGVSPCLVYQYMSNGSLADRLLLKGGSLPLSWRQRYDIGKGTACGLQFLHTIHKIPIIHGDIKSANILLDKHFEPKIGDFGLARETSADNSLKLSKPHGTLYYVPEDFMIENILSTKVDIYSFGVVMYELATGSLVKKQTKGLNEYVHSLTPESVYLLKDSKAGDEFDKAFILFMLVISECTKELAENRPEMTVVYEQFKY